MPKGVQIIWTPWKQRSELLQVRQWLYNAPRSREKNIWGIENAGEESEGGASDSEIRNGNAGTQKREEDARRTACDMVSSKSVLVLSLFPPFSVRSQARIECNSAPKDFSSGNSECRIRVILFTIAP